MDDTCAIRLTAESPTQLAGECADAVRLLVTQPELRGRMGEAGRRKIETTHLWDQRVRQMMALYEEIISRR